MPKNMFKGDRTRKQNSWAKWHACHFALECGNILREHLAIRGSEQIALNASIVHFLKVYINRDSNITMLSRYHVHFTLSFNVEKWCAKNCNRIDSAKCWIRYCIGWGKLLTRLRQILCEVFCWAKWHACQFPLVCGRLKSQVKPNRGITHILPHTEAKV